MSKGMKQKTAIVAAFMTDPAVYVLDEPSTGLDPLMRAEFVEILRSEKARGKTIFMSTHMFEEVEDVCDRVALIKDGRVVAVKSTDEIRHNSVKTYKIEFGSPEDYRRFTSERFEFTKLNDEKNQAFARVNDAEINRFLSVLKGYRLKYITEIKYTFEQYFKGLYKKQGRKGHVQRNDF
jgi:ABC-2 type transport system ATP-binding protein